MGLIEQKQAALQAAADVRGKLVAIQRGLPLIGGKFAKDAKTEIAKGSWSHVALAGEKTAPTVVGTQADALEKHLKDKTDKLVTAAIMKLDTAVQLLENVS